MTVNKQDLDDLLGIRSAVNELTIAFENNDEIEADKRDEIVRSLDDTYNQLSFTIGLVSGL